MNNQPMTAPDYGRCWKCGGETHTTEAGYVRCEDRECLGYMLLLDKSWRIIHNYLAAVREEERERCAKQIDKDIDELFDYHGPERAIGHTLADLVRKGE